MKKLFVILLASAMMLTLFACAKADSREEIIGGADKTENIIVSEPKKTTSSTSAPTSEETTQSEEEKMIAIADKAFEKADLSMSGADSRNDFKQASCVFLEEGAETDLVNQWADLLGQDVWYIEYVNKKTNMDCFYYVLSTDGEILDSGYMGV